MRLHLVLVAVEDIYHERKNMKYLVVGLLFLCIGCTGNNQGGWRGPQGDFPSNMQQTGGSDKNMLVSMV